MSCRFVASDQPRMLRTHDRECNTSGCQGCQPCPESHCGICGHEHVTVDGRGTDLHCASCVGEVRTDLGLIVARAEQLLTEAVHRGINSEAANLAGPAPDSTEGIEAHRWRQMSAFWGRIPELDEDDQHPLWVLGTWETLVREHLKQPTRKRVRIDRARTYLDQHLTRLAHDRGFAFEELARDARRCRGHLEDVLHDSRKGQQGAPCPMCGRAKLELQHADCECGTETCSGRCAEGDRWCCPRCSSAYTEGDYRAKVQGIYVQTADRLTARQITATYRVPEGSVRAWASLGKVTRRGKDQHGLTLYDVAEVLALRDGSCTVASTGD